MGTESKGGLFRYADRTDKLLLLFGILGSMGDGMMSPLSMYVLSGVINELGSSDISASNEIVDKYTLRLLYVAILVGVSAFIEGVCWTRTAERQASRMRVEYLKSVLRQEVSYFDNQTASSTTFQVVSIISSDAHTIQDTIAEKIPNTLAHLTSFIFCLGVAFILSWRLALAALPFSLLFIVPGVVFGTVLKKLGGKGKDAYDIAGGIAEQAISSIRTVYSYVGENQTLNRFSHALQERMELGIKQGFTKGLLMGSMGMIYAAWAFQSWVGSVLVTERGEKGGAVFIAAVCTTIGGVAIMGALPNLSFISQATIAATRIFEMIDRIPDINSEDEKGKIRAYVRGEIEFKEVDFSYPTRPNTPILKGFNLKVQAGKTVGLVGGSGSGKSTVISLLERFYDPVNGNILLDGHQIKRLQLKWLRSHMGLVNQEPILFATSIMENILFGKEGASMEEVVKAAKAANAHDFIVKLTDGYETKVGQLGVQLSGGQKQRIAIARALIRDPKILLLDEATSALDAQSEKIVQEALDQASQGRTTIIIAHRLTTIRKANLITVLQSGRVIESGSHDELMQMNNGEGGAYSKMVKLQGSATSNQTEGRNHISLMRAQTPQTPLSVRSSYQNSPVYPFSPVFSIDMAHSFQMHGYENQNEKNIKNNPDSPSTKLRLLQMSVTEWKRTVLGCVGAAGSGAINPVYAYCLGSVVSVYFLKDNSRIKSETRMYCFIFLGLTVLNFISHLLQHYNFAIMGEHLVKKVREKMLGKILTFEIGWFDQDENTSAAICARLANEANMVQSFIADRMSLLIQVFFSASLAFTLGLLVTWRIAIIMIAIQPLVIGSFYSKSVLMKSMSEKARKAQNEGSQLASEATINHRTITAFSSQNRILGLFIETMKGPKKESIKQSWFSGIGLFTSQFLTTASIALVYWYGGRIMNQGLVTPTHLFQAFFILMSTGKNIADAGSMTSDLAKGGNAIKTIFTILDRRSEIEPEEPRGKEAIKDTSGHIELKNIFFCYPSRPDQMIFCGLSLKIEGGKTVALVGQSGSGKSTIIGLIERFYDPQSGVVLIDECDIKNYNLRSLRLRIALVSQEPTLFAGTIRENITYGKEDATEAEIRKAATLANAHEFISSMKDGYETYCGERGVQLSGGQKQRIALARAVLKDPMILLLDEATSALDNVSENLVQEALEKMMVGRTCVIVAHRLSTIQKADTIAVIKNGKVVEQGSHSNLLATGTGAYYSLIKLQGSNSPYR
ncbi:putative multidrug resistance protein [Pistacia vera]|uniref:putative multidrug resistance protein n=1 Tax=Pistacia vera TaxID=55513 RepID=UPI0012637506|nr:putative multidrug resistance protein [Pistacia vera]